MFFFWTTSFSAWVVFPVLFPFSAKRWLHFRINWFEDIVKYFDKTSSKRLYMMLRFQLLSVNKAPHFSWIDSYTLFSAEIKKEMLLVYKIKLFSVSRSRIFLFSFIKIAHDVQIVSSKFLLKKYSLLTSRIFPLPLPPVPSIIWSLHQLSWAFIDYSVWTHFFKHMFSYCF